jgi:hypothetical protein
MLSEAERAAFRVLLDRALRNEEITDEEAQAILPHDLFLEFAGLAIKRHNAIVDAYNEEAWANWRIDPEEVRDYRNALALTKKAYAEAPAKLEKLKQMLKTAPKKAYATRNRIKQQYKVLANGPEACWRAYNKLSDEAKLWTVPGNWHGSEWPPTLVDEPPIELVLPGVEKTNAFAIRHTLSPLLEDE